MIARVGGAEGSGLIDSDFTRKPIEYFLFQDAEESYIFYLVPLSQFFLATLFKLRHTNNVYYVVRALTFSVCVTCCCIFIVCNAVTCTWLQKLTEKQCTQRGSIVQTS